MPKRSRERNLYLAGRRELNAILASLDDDAAKAVWEYLDACPRIATDLIDQVARTHKDLAVKVCGPVNPTLTRKLRF